MSSKQLRTPPSIDSEREPDDTPATVQLLVTDTGNRTVIEMMLDDFFEVETSQTVRDADLYLIEDHLFSEYHETLRERVEHAHPTFCPVVLIRRKTTELAHPTEDTALHEGPLLIDDVVDAPIDKSLLIRRLHSLLVRRRQSQELSSHISTLEEREQELRRFERGVESTGNGIVMTDRFGEIEYANPAIEKITGYTETDVLGETARIFQPVGAADVFTEEFWRTMVNRKEWVGEVVIEHSDEARSVVDTSITATHDESGDVEGFVMVLNDITERIQHQQALQSREQELDLLRQILTRYLRHNLRNDLNVILGYGEMLATDETLSDSQIQMAGKIVETAQRLQEKSDTARQFSTLLQQDTELSPYDLSEIVKECAQTISEQYPDVAFDIDVPDSCEIRARTGIRNAVEELIENAAKHNDADSPHVQVQLRNLNGARLRIEDNGPGISELELGTLEVGEETPLLHSQGVGLWLSKWILESVDGQLSFDRIDLGTRVTVEFPSPERVGSRGLDIPTLKERDQRLQTVIDRMTNAIVEVNGAWEITFVDPRAEEILDVSADEIRGQKFWDVFSDARDTQFESVYRDAMESRTSQHVEDYYSGIDGWLSVYAYPEFGGGLSLYFQETTERYEQRQALEQARSRIELALEVTDAAVWEWVPQTDTVTVHPEQHPVFDTEIQTGDDFIKGIHPDDRSRVQNALETAVKTGSPYDVEYRVTNGETVRWASDYGEVRSRKDGDGPRVVGVARDITDRKERERELRELEEFNRELVENAPVGLFRLDEQMRLIYENERAEEIMGVPEDEDESVAIGTDPRDIPSVRDEVGRDVFDRLEAGDTVSFELPFESLYGKKRYVIGQGVPLFDNGDFNGAILMVQDVTEQREREQLFEAVFNNTYTFTGVMDPDGTLQEANETALSFGGIDREDVIGKPIWDAYWFQENQHARQTARKAVTHAQKGELFREHIQVQGEDDVIVIDFTVRPVFDEGGSVTFLIPEGRDITELKEREQQLEAEQRRFQSLVDVLPHGVYRSDPDTLETTYANNMVERIHGYRDGEWHENPDLWKKTLHPNDAPTVRETFQAHRESREPGQLEYRIQTSGGDTRWIEDTFRWEYDESGNVMALVGVYTDITKRKEYELHLETIIDNLPGFVYRHKYDSEYPLQFVKGDAETVTGYTAAELEEDIILAEDIIHPADRKNLWTEHIKGIEESGRFDSTYRIITKDGDVRWVRDQGQLLEDPVTGEEVIDGFLTDVSDHIQRERDLRRQQTFIDESLDALQDVFYTINEDEELIRWNNRVSEVSGYTDEEIEEITVTEFFAEEHHDRMKNSIEETMETGSSVVRADVRTTDGERLPFEFRGTRLTDSDRDETVAVGVGRDISKQVKLERSQDLLEHTEQIADVGGWEIDTDTMDVFGSESLFDILWIDANEESPFDELLDAYHEDDRPVVEAAVEDALEAGEPFDIEARFQRPDDEIRWLRVQGTPTVEDGEVVSLRGAVQDITEYKEREREL